MQVLLARSIERSFGRQAAASLCVTQAMQQELAGSWGIQATVFHDKAPADFRPTLLSDQHALFLKLQVGLLPCKLGGRVTGRRLSPESRACQSAVQPLVDTSCRCAQAAVQHSSTAVLHHP